MREQQWMGPELVRPQLWVLCVAVLAAALGLYALLARPHMFAGIPVTPHPRVAGAFVGVMQNPLPPVADCSVHACIALTFDDGPNAVVTPQVLNVLERHHVRATFFVIGNRIPGNEALLRRMYKEGHEVGNHSWSHPDFTTLPPDQIQQQIVQTQAVIMNAGLPAPTLFRPPYGAVNAVVKNRVPMTFAMWNVDPEDWRSKDPKEIIAKIEAAVRPGRVVDLHDIHQPTADSLDQLLTDLQQHYQLVTFSDLFNLEPGQPGLFYGR